MGYLDTILAICRALTTSKVAIKCLKEVVVLLNYTCNCPQDTQDTNSKEEI